MRAFIFGILVALNTQAQTLDLYGFKQLLTLNQRTLESVRAGMTKETVTTGTIATDTGVCGYRETLTQTILKIEDQNLLVYSKEKFQPQATGACATAGYRAYTETMLFYEAKPLLKNFLADLDNTTVKNLYRQGQVVSLVTTVENEELEFKYDLTKSGFSNVVEGKGPAFRAVTREMANLDVNSLDLTDILFCPEFDAEAEDCVQGDFSDVLY